MADPDSEELIASRYVRNQVARGGCAWSVSGSRNGINYSLGFRESSFWFADQAYRTSYEALQSVRER
jgi:hypothetical protein